jgi:hypothetical protein
MLQNLSLEVRECMERARECAERAKVEPDPLVQRNYLDLERRWIQLARSLQCSEQRRQLPEYIVERPPLSERLEQLRDQMRASASRDGPSN